MRTAELAGARAPARKLLMTNRARITAQTTQKCCWTSSTPGTEALVKEVILFAPPLDPDIENSAKIMPMPTPFQPCFANCGLVLLIYF